MTYRKVEEVAARFYGYHKATDFSYSSTNNDATQSSFLLLAISTQYYDIICFKVRQLLVISWRVDT